MANTARWMCVPGVALLLAVFELRHLFLFYPAQLAAHIAAATGVTTGYPHWRVYQNRILGPYLVTGLDVVLPGGYAGAYLVALVLLLTLAGIQAWRVGNRLGGRKSGWLALTVLHLLFVFFLSAKWLYIWDFIGLNVFLVFVECALCRVRWQWFALLFGVAILNRESGQFIALWMVLEPLSRWFLGRPMSKAQGFGLAVSGLCCAGIGAWLVRYLRTVLLVQEIGFTLTNNGTTSGYGANVHWKAASNVHYLLHAGEAGVRGVLELYVPVAVIVAAIVLAITLVCRDAVRYAAFSFTLVAVIGSILLFGAIGETRVFVEVIPFLLVGVCLGVCPEGQTPLPDASQASA